MRFISCRPSPRKNLLRFSDRIRQEQRELKRFSIISISSLVLGSCLLYAWISKGKSEIFICVQLYIIIPLIRLLSVIRTVSKNYLLPTAVIKHQCHLNLPVADDFLFKKLLLLEHIDVEISFQSENLSSLWWAVSYISNDDSSYNFKIYIYITLSIHSIYQISYLVYNHIYYISYHHCFVIIWPEFHFHTIY